ncbi:MAG TPA: hypothetical protein VGE07_04575 [Herpetosiphonaceae bacterium]
MSAPVYRVFVENRTAEEVRELIRANPDSTLNGDAYTEEGFVTDSASAAKALKSQLRDCLNYGYQMARAALRNAGKRHQTGTLEAEWRASAVIIDPNPEGQHLMR